ncbi:transposase DDE domain protein [Leptospira borgpetersenii str. Brem 307]|uniref:Transposase DDE domain protein n=1 Tax=Leptospira borgpetersenii str. Brem 328 TaxID=1049780 RepID=A0ABC9SFA8_LEPBO|nr:transposase DDE domain protein [Leptospira borgpetersenii str. Brem 307]EMN16427.1 transposase DDE domain protein [Leptospira borgpetersenii str. Brem 328]
MIIHRVVLLLDFWGYSSPGFILVTFTLFTSHLHNRAGTLRWAVERTNSWNNRFKAILIRWERKSENYLASFYLASSIITFNSKF